MAEKQATYKIRVDGDDDLVRAGDRIDQRWSSLGKKLKDGVGGAVKSVAQGMLGLVNDSIRVATAVNTINLGQLVSDTKRLELSYTKFAVGTKSSIARVSKEAEELGKKLLMDPGDVLAAAGAYNKLTYQVRATKKDLEATNAVAKSQGQELGDVLPLTVLLRNAGGAAVDMQEEFGKIADQADKLGYAGGPKALQDALMGAAGALQHVSLESAEARTKVTAFLGALTKGLSPDSQKAVTASVSSQVYGRAEQISRTVGYDILDPKTGKVKDLGKVMRDLRSRALRLYGTQGALKVLRREFGNEEGTALYNYDDAAAQRAGAADASSEAGQAGPRAQREIDDSDAGRRERERLEREAKLREQLGKPLSDAQSAWANLWSDDPLAGQVANLAAEGGGIAGTGYLGKRLVGAGLGKLGLGAGTKAAAGLAEGALPAAEGALSLGEAQASLAASELFGKTAISWGAKGAGRKLLSSIPILGQAFELAQFQYQGIDSLGKDSEFAQERRGQVRSAAAQEIAGRIARGAAAGKYQDIYQAAPEIARLAQGAGVGKEGGVEDTLREVVRLLAESRQEGISSEFQASVKNAFKDALRESGATVTTGENPSRGKTAKAEAGGEGSV